MAEHARRRSRHCARWGCATVPDHYPAPALRRRTAACRARQRLRHQAGRAVRRRADRQPGCGDGRPHRAAALRNERPFQHHPGAGDPRPRSRRALRAGHAHGSRAAEVAGMRAALLAMRMLSREWRSGELGVLLLALTIAVAALTGVGFLVSRISAAVTMQAGQVLAADIRLESPQPIGEEPMTAARQGGLRTARSHGPAQRRLRGRRQPARRHRRRHRGISAARPCDGGGAALRRRAGGPGHSAAGRGLAGLAPARGARRRMSAPA